MAKWKDYKPSKKYNFINIWFVVFAISNKDYFVPEEQYID